MKKLILFVALVVSGVVSAAPYRLGLASYTFCRKGVDETLAMMQRADCHCLCLKTEHVSYDSDDAQIAAFKAKAAKFGVEADIIGPPYICDEAAARRLFAFAKRYGAKRVVTIPYEMKNGRRVASARMIDVLEKLVKEYDILCAIHNHGPDMPELWPTAESIMKVIEKRDRRLGLCLDVVHESRAGVDPVASIRRYGERIYDVHINNARLPRDAQGRLAKDRKGRVPYLPVACPRGDINLVAVCRALAAVGFDGTIHLEHAISRKGDEREIAESIGYLRGLLDSIPGRPSNADEAGFVPLFNGRDLTGWEGATNTYCVTKEGYLTCLQRGGKGESGTKNLWTARDYADFIIRFDVKLPRNANNGLGIRTPPNGWCSHDGMEIQLLDDWGPQWNGAKTLYASQYTGSIYGVVPPARRVNGQSYLKKPGEWNAIEVKAVGPRITVTVNGTVVTDADVSKYSATGAYLPDRHKHPGLHNRTGRIHWCGHGYEIFWRNVRIKELKK